MVDIFTVFVFLFIIATCAIIGFFVMLERAYGKIERLTIKLRVAKGELWKRLRQSRFRMGAEDDADFLKRTEPVFESTCPHTQSSKFKELTEIWVNMKAEIEKTFNEKLKEAVGSDKVADKVGDLIKLREQALEEGFTSCVGQIGFSFRPVEIGYGTPRKGVVIRLQGWVCNRRVSEDFDPIRQYSYLLGMKKDDKK